MRGFEIAAPQTAGTWLRRFTLGHIRQLDKALIEVHRNAFAAAKTTAVTLDFDSSYVFSRTKRRQGADRTYKKGYALHPLFCFEASTGLAVHARLRRGRAGASTGMESFLRETLRRIPDGITIRARFDSGFYSDRLFTQLENANVTYVCGVPLNTAIKATIAEIPDESWGPCLDDKDGHVAEFIYRMQDAKRSRRYVVKRIPAARGEQLELDSGAYHYWCSVTNDDDARAADVESEHRHKALVEGGVRELKSNYGLHALRKHRTPASTPGSRSLTRRQLFKHPDACFSVRQDRRITHDSPLPASHQPSANTHTHISALDDVRELQSGPKGRPVHVTEGFE